MAILRVQGNARGTSTTASIIVTMASTPISGNVLVLTFANRADSAVSISSVVETGVVWSSVVASSNGQCGSAIWFGVVGAGASKTITVSLSGNAQYGGVVNVCEYSGVATSGYLDKTASATGTNNLAKTGDTATTTQAVELWVGSNSCNNGGQSNATNNFALLDGVQYSGCTNAFLEKIVSTMGIASCNTTITSGTEVWAGCIATFKGVAGTAYSKTVSEILGLVDGKSSKTAFHKTTSEVLGLKDGYDKNRCKKCKPSVTLTF